MKAGTRVQTEHGPGAIMHTDAEWSYRTPEGTFVSLPSVMVRLDDDTVGFYEPHTVVAEVVREVGADDRPLS